MTDKSLFRIKSGVGAAVLIATALLYSAMAHAVSVSYLWVPDDNAISGEMLIEIGTQDPDNFTVAAADFNTPSVDFNRFTAVCPTPVVCPVPITFDNFLKAGFLDIPTATITAVAGQITVLDMQWNQADGNTLLIGAGNLDVIHAGTTNTHTGMWVNAAAVVPIPPAVWLFGSGLLGLIVIARRKAA